MTCENAAPKANPSKANKATPHMNLNVNSATRVLSTQHLDLRHSGSYQRQGQQISGAASQLQRLLRVASGAVARQLVVISSSSIIVALVAQRVVGVQRGAPPAFRRGAGILLNALVVLVGLALLAID